MAGKVSIIGTGMVGVTLAQHLAACDLADVVCLGKRKGPPHGKALDMLEGAPLLDHSRTIVGTNDYKDTKDSDIVVIAAGLAFKPAMSSRDDLLASNTTIVKETVERAAEHSPDAVFIVVTNPLDTMTYWARSVCKLPHQRVIGMAGLLDSARFQAFVASELRVSPRDIKTMILGGHGELMVPIPRYTSVYGIPITELLSPDRIDALCRRARDGGAEMVLLLQTHSASYAPGIAVSIMVSAILKDENRLLPCSVYANGEYGLQDTYVGLPAVLGKGGVKKIIELELTDQEATALQHSAAAIRQTISALPKLSSTDTASS